MSAHETAPERDEPPMRTMRCAECGAAMSWRGRLSALTHRECDSCGGREMDGDDDDAEGGEA